MTWREENFSPASITEMWRLELDKNYGLVKNGRLSQAWIKSRDNNEAAGCVESKLQVDGMMDVLQIWALLAAVHTDKEFLGRWTPSAVSGNERMICFSIYFMFVFFIKEKLSVLSDYMKKKDLFLLR